MTEWVFWGHIHPPRGVVIEWRHWGEETSRFGKAEDIICSSYFNGLEVWRLPT